MVAEYSQAPFVDRVHRKVEAAKPRLRLGVKRIASGMIEISRRASSHHALELIFEFLVRTYSQFKQAFLLRS